MLTISLMNAKGGVAKSTSSLCLASYFAQKKQRVLFIDLDPQANATKTLLEIELGRFAAAPTLYDVLYSFIMESRKNTVAEAIKPVYENLDLLPASPRMEPFKDLVKANSRRPLDVLKFILQPIKQNYDVIVIDCPADLSIYVENAIEVSDLILLPTTYDLYGLDGLALIIPVILEIKGSDFESYRAFYTLHNSRATKIQQDIGAYAKTLEEMNKVLPYKVPIDQMVKNSQASKRNLITDSLYRNSRARQAYTSLGEHILENWNS